MTKLFHIGDAVLSSGVYAAVLKLRRIADSFERDGMSSSAGAMREAVAVIVELEDKLRRKGSAQARGDRAAIAAIEDGWEAIETAPKDGSNILIIAMGAYSPEARQGWWDGDWWAFYSRPEKFVVDGPTHMLEVSHWRPLPPPPEGGL